MHKLFFLLIVSLMFTACEPTRRAAPPLPPGVERGQTWEEASDHGYEEPVYTTPEYIAYPLKGTRALLSEVQKVYRQDVCSDGDSRIILQHVVDKEGNISGLYPIGNVNPVCKEQLLSVFERFTFFPAEHENKKVAVLLAIAVHDRRI